MAYKILHNLVLAQVHVHPMLTLGSPTLSTYSLSIPHTLLLQSLCICCFYYLGLTFSSLYAEIIPIYSLDLNLCFSREAFLGPLRLDTASLMYALIETPMSPTWHLLQL